MGPLGWLILGPFIVGAYVAFWLVVGIIWLLVAIVTGLVHAIHS